MHVILHCNAYKDLRNILITMASSLLPTFNSFTQNDKMKFLLSHPSMIRLFAKTRFNILLRRNSLLQM